MSILCENAFTAAPSASSSAGFLCSMASRSALKFSNPVKGLPREFIFTYNVLSSFFARPRAAAGKRIAGFTGSVSRSQGGMQAFAGLILVVPVQSIQHHQHAWNGGSCFQVGRWLGWSHSHAVTG